MKRIITMSQFGKWGRSGNQFFEYAFLSGYAAQHGAELQLPPWVGNQLFGVENPPVSVELPPWLEEGRGLNNPTPPDGDEVVGRDFRGYAMYHTGCVEYSGERDRIRRVFQPVASVKERLAPAVMALQSNGNATIGIHLRRGDYGRSIFPVIPTSWYLKWLDAHWRYLDSPTLFIATESPGLVEEFAEYKPETAVSLGLSLSDKPMADCTYLKEDIGAPTREAMDWFPDFHLLSKCDIVLGPSSTFSFFAAMLNPSLCEYWRASLAAAAFERTDPWDAYPSLRENVRAYSHLEGIALPHNPPHW